MTRRAGSSTAPETAAEPLPGSHWPRDDHELEARRSRRERIRHATESLPPGMRDDSSIGTLMFLRTEYDDLCSLGFDATMRVAKYRGHPMLTRSIPILAHPKLDALELEPEALESELLKDLGRGIQLRLNRMAKRDQEAALARSRAIALGHEVDTLIKRMMSPELPAHRRREAHEDLRRISPTRAGEFVALMEADLSRIEGHERVERLRVQAEQERKWAEGIHEAQAETQRVLELGERTIVEGA